MKKRVEIKVNLIRLKGPIIFRKAKRRVEEDYPGWTITSFLTTPIPDENSTIVELEIEKDEKNEKEKQ